MNEDQIFQYYYTPEQLQKLYFEKIKYRATAGMDRISPSKFDDNLKDNIRIISQKALDGTYKFTRYKEILISKGRGKMPRVISIPTIRDKLALAAYHKFLQNMFKETVEDSFLHSIVTDIAQIALSGQFDGYVKIDITQFYASINHQLLLKKVEQRVQNKAALHFLTEAITTETISQAGPHHSKSRNSHGVPEGLSISNILANIYLSDLREKVCAEYNIHFFRYVDDILILCRKSQAEDIKEFCIQTLDSSFLLQANKDKTKSGSISDGVSYLGYVFFDSKIGIRPASREKLETSIEELYRLRNKNLISHKIFVWRLNLKITGCIFDSKKYGWLFYYSQLTDLGILFHLDWLIDRLSKRFGFPAQNVIKSFVRSYYEITKNAKNSNYIINVDKYSTEQKRELLLDMNLPIDFDQTDKQAIDHLFNTIMFREIRQLESDIRNLS